MRPRVAMVGYTFYASDGRLRTHVGNLVRSGYGVDVITLRNPRGVEEQDEEHVRFILPQTRRYARQGKAQFILDYVAFTLRTAMVLLRRHLFGQRYSVVHINNMPNFLIFAALPLRLLGVPVILDVHDTMPEVFQDRASVSESHWMIKCLWVEEWLCLKLADFVITTEHTKLERLVENGLREDKAAVLLNLANPEIFPLREIRDDAPEPSETFRLVYHGTLTRRLGVDIAIRAVGLLRGRIPGVRLDVTGDGEQRDELVALAKELGLEDCVGFSDGMVPTDELAGRLEGAQLGVLASRVNNATRLMLPVKLLEYVQLGIPCVAVSTHTISYYFDEPQVHFAEPENPEDMADRIFFLYENPEVRCASARAARSFYDEHNYDSQRERYIALIEQLTGEVSVPPPENPPDAVAAYFRAADGAMDFKIAGPLCGRMGYFSFGDGVVCFGRTVSGNAGREPQRDLVPFLPGISSTGEGSVPVLEFDPNEVAQALRTEMFMRASGIEKPNRLLDDQFRWAYYLVRPHIPAEARRHLQRRALAGWESIPFPRWPVDTSVDDMMEGLLKLALEGRGGEPLPFIWFWPEGHGSALMMTHDVETEEGRDKVEALMEFDEGYGFCASFQIVPEDRYEIPAGYLEGIRGRGFEVGVHGLNHDGGLFSSREEFYRRALKINRYGKEFGALGFRSPIMYRNAEWFDALDFEFDMSIPSVSHLEPQRGGCCTVMPYMIGDLVELPLTTTQDYSILYILEDESISLWREQVDAIMARHGLISFIVHPDYAMVGKGRELCMQLYEYLRDQLEAGGVWHALPSEIARWWKQRHEMQLVEEGDGWRIVGEGSERARAAYARLEDGRVRYTVEGSD